MTTCNLAPPRGQRNDLRSPPIYDLTLFAIAFLTGSAALWTGAAYGFERGGILGAAVGVASALGCLLAPGLVLDAIRSREPGRIAAGAAMLVISTAFALSGALGAAAAARDVAARIEAKRSADHARLASQHARVSAELDRLPPARPSAVIEAELRPILADTRLADCQGWLAGATLRNTCIREVEPRRKELAVAHAREKLTADVALASSALAGTDAGRPASADAAGLARLAGRLGLPVAADTIADVLLVVLVLAVELVGGLALALVRRRVPTLDAVAVPTGGALVPAVSPVFSMHDAVPTLAASRVPTLGPPSAPPAMPVPAQPASVGTPSASVGTPSAILAMLRDNGGTFTASQRALAARLGVSVSEANRQLHSLAASGLVTLQPGAKGTLVRLA